MNKRKNGSYYTPPELAAFIVQYLTPSLAGKGSISAFEPSAGDGVFVNALYNNDDLRPTISKVVAVEKNKTELNKIDKEGRHANLLKVHSDFLEYQKNTQETYSLVIGNPPYVKSNLLQPKQVKSSRNIHERADLKDVRPKNIWSAFLVRCIRFTKTDGIMAFILPSEFLQVKFAGELRELILSEFERVELFTFNELLFKECKGQDTFILICHRQHTNKGIYHCNIHNVADLTSGNFELQQSIKLKESKWTHNHLDSSEVELMEKLRAQIENINYYSTSKAGIVTAANDFFIIDKELVKEYNLDKFIKPIIQRGIFVNGGVTISKPQFKNLIKASKPSYLLALNDNSKVRSNHKVWDYLEIGEERGLHNRYKTSIRTTWYQVPNVGNPAQAFFFKRCNEYPKFIKNGAKVLVTDSAYEVTIKPQFNIESLIFSFYNSLTLAFAELHGRYYGGGVLELTPNEFKNLPVPYLPITNEIFREFANKFKNKGSIKEICNLNDALILRSIDPHIDDDSIKKIAQIREKLHLRRIKTN